MTPARGLSEGARALGLALDDEQCERLLAFGALLLKWNRTHNLTAIESGEEALTHHLLDSLAIVPRVTRDAPQRVLDVGSGGGLPAIPLAIACPQLQVTALDKVGKKVAFLTQAKVDLALANLQPVAARVEQWRPPAPFDFIVARALGSLAELVTLTQHLLAADGRWLAMKGRRPDAELGALPRTVAVVGVTPLHVPGLDQARHLVELKRAA